jgi:glycerol-3-phosphate dehydrogenase
MIRVIGVKFTTAPSLARRVADLAAARLGRGTPASSAAPGASPSPAVDDESLERLRSESPAAREVLSKHPFVDAAQVIHAVRREMAHTLADIALRRTPLAMLGPPPDAALRRCAAIAGELLGWDEARRAREIDDVRVKAKGPVADIETSESGHTRRFA